MVLQTIVVNWSYVGGSRGAYVLRPREVPFGFDSYSGFLCAVVVVLAAAAVAIARTIEKSASASASPRCVTMRRRRKRRACRRCG
ncbi:hypothetical protein ACFQU7_32055 [Pseudoroseomonas wenyumeiae]